MDSSGSRMWLIALVGVLAIAVLACVIVAFLPPFQLAEKLQGGDYTSLTTESPVAFHEDGLRVLASPEELDGSFSVQLDSVPQLSFLEGSAGDELRLAAQALPANLIVKSPFYEISAKGTAPDSTIIALDIPNNAEPWETLDLYTWTGEEWQWVGSRVDGQRELILAQVGQEVPDSVVVMQTVAIAPAVGTNLPLDQPATGAANSGVNHLFPLGLHLGDMGTIEGNPTRLPVPAPGDTYALMPSIRNWSNETGVNQELLTSMLSNPGMREAHIANIAALVAGQGYAGIELDYQGVSDELRDVYSEFVGTLAETLRAQGKKLSVAVATPLATGNGDWDTGGYDWRALGQAADMLRVSFPSYPAYFGGDREGFLTWTLNQVSRYKLLPTISTYSSDQVAGRVSAISQAQALAPLSSVTGPENPAASPGDTITFSLDEEIQSTLQHDEINRTYTFTYQDDQGTEHRVTVSTTASLAAVLDSLLHRHVGGAFVEGLLQAANDPALADVIRQFATQTPPSASDALQVTWTVKSATGEQLTRVDRPLGEASSFEWTVPDDTGEYLVSATIGSQTGGPTETASTFTVNVEASEPADPSAAEVAATPTPKPDSNSDAPEEVADSDACLKSSYVADVTVPDNTRFEKAEAFVKTWRVSNSGTCAWPEDTVLSFVNGDALGAPSTVQVGSLDTGQTTEISVDMVAPDADGSYQGTWRLSQGGNKPYGTNLTVVIKVGEESAQPAPAPAPAPPPSGGGAFELGGHIRTWNFTNYMKNAGMTWAKVQIHYGQDAVGLVNTARSNGFKIQLSALGTPGMVTQPNFHNDYSAWVAGLAAAGADAIEVWNEPNIDREWQIGQISPQAYTQLLCASYSAIKAANPNTKVISAAPAPTGYFGGCSGNGCDDQPFLQGMAAAGAVNCMDYIGAHHNSGATSPSATSGHPADSGGGHHSWYFLPQTQLYYNIFGGARKLFYTEMGYASQEGLEQFSDQFAWARGTNNSQQATWLAEAVRLSRSTGTVANIIVWNIDFSRYGYDPQDGYAIVRPGGGCPACDTLRGALQ